MSSIVDEVFKPGGLIAITPESVAELSNEVVRLRALAKRFSEHCGCEWCQDRYAEALKTR